MLEATLPPIILQYNTSVVFPLLHSIVLLTDSWQGDKSKCQWYWQDTTGYFLYWAPSQHLQFWPNRGRKYSILYMDQAKTFTKCVLSVYFEWRNWWTLSLSQLFKPFKEGKSTLECQSIKSCESKHSFCPCPTEILLQCAMERVKQEQEWGWGGEGSAQSVSSLQTFQN